MSAQGPPGRELEVEDLERPLSGVFCHLRSQVQGTEEGQPSPQKEGRGVESRQGRHVLPEEDIEYLHWLRADYSPEDQQGHKGESEDLAERVCLIYFWFLHWLCTITFSGW